MRHSPSIAWGIEIGQPLGYSSALRRRLTQSLTTSPSSSQPHSSSHASRMLADDHLGATHTRTRSWECYEMKTKGGRATTFGYQHSSTAILDLVDEHFQIRRTAGRPLRTSQGTTVARQARLGSPSGRLPRRSLCEYTQYAAVVMLRRKRRRLTAGELSFRTPDLRAITVGTTSTKHGHTLNIAQFLAFEPPSVNTM